jgi:hypothetical protein
MKKLILFAISAVFSLTVFSQGEYDELLILKADQNWEKLIRQAEKLTLKESTKNDPLPYYYMAYGLYKISFIGDRDEAYKNAFKDAIAIIGKMDRKDADKAVFNKYMDFFNDVKSTLFELIRNDLEAADYRRGFGWVMKLYKFDRDDIGGKLLEGACRYRNGDKATARTKWKEAKDIITATKSTDGWMPIDREIIKFGLYETAKCHLDARQPAEAKAVMNLGAQWFEKDKDWKKLYDEIVN